MASTVGSRLYTSKIAATGAALSDRRVGFKPRRVEIYNMANQYRALWNEQLADDAAVVIAPDGTRTDVSADGITPLAPDTAGNPGFGLGTLANLNDTVGEMLVVECWD